MSTDIEGITPEEWEHLRPVLVARAAEIRHQEGLADHRGYSAGDALQGQVEFYDAVVAGQVPKPWVKEVTKYRNERDPEWTEYLRLKARFEPVGA